MRRQPRSVWCGQTLASPAADCPAHLAHYACELPAHHVGAHSATSGGQVVRWLMEGGEGWGEVRAL